MAIEASTPTTRRALIAGGLGAAAAVAINAIAGPKQALAADPNDVVLGAANISTATTGISDTTNGSLAFSASAVGGGNAIQGTSDFGEGVHGTSSSLYGVRGVTNAGAGVYGTSTSGAGVAGGSSTGHGVQGFSTSSVGVFGESIDHIGVFGITPETTQPAILGHSVGDFTGVQGWSGAAGPPAAKTKTGVYGAATQDTSSRGVWGESTAGRGVNGVATSGIGVWGEATTGYALRTSGRVRLDKSSGKATIASGTSSVVVTPGFDLTPASAVVATLNGNAGGSTVVKRVSINTVANTFTIYLTANSTATIKVAWIVLG